MLRSRILRQLWVWVWIGDWSGLDPVWVDFLSLPLGISAVCEEVAEGFVAVQPCLKLRLPYLELLFVESSCRKLRWWPYLCDRHLEVVSLFVLRLESLSLFTLCSLYLHYFTVLCTVL